MLVVRTLIVWRARVVMVRTPGAVKLVGDSKEKPTMATTPTKRPKPPVRNAATTGKPTTPSGQGVVNRGRLEAGAKQTSNGKSSTRTATTARPTNRDLDSTSSGDPGGNWWESTDRHPAEISRDLHQLADSIFRPVGADADRPTGPRSKVPDDRLYQVKPRTPTKSNSKASGGPTASGAGVVHRGRLDATAGRTVITTSKGSVPSGPSLI